MRMRHIVICGLSGCKIFFHIFSSMARFSGGGGFTGNKMWILVFSTNYVLKISRSKKKRARYDYKYILVLMYSTRYSRHILIKLEFSRHIFENSQITNCLKIRPVEAELFHADGRTDMMKLIAVFRNFTNAPKK
jgi:hypothetical protein